MRERSWLRRAAEERDELTMFRLIELHLLPISEGPNLQGIKTAGASQVAAN